MKKHFLLACLLMAMGGVYPDVVNAQCGDNGDGTSLILYFGQMFLIRM